MMFKISAFIVAMIHTIITATNTDAKRNETSPCQIFDVNKH